MIESSGQSGFYKLGRDFNKIVAVGKRVGFKVNFSTAWLYANEAPMNLKLKLAFVLYSANIFVLIVIGFAFEFRSEFLPFHSEVIQTAWQDLGVNPQILYLGMMRTEGAGFLATATALTFLLCVPFRKYEKWSYWGITIIGVVEYLPTLLANYHVASVTNASPPWLFMLLLTLSLFVALILASIGHKERIALRGVESESI